MNRIYLHSRNRFKCWLEENSDGTYSLNSENNEIYSHIRVIFDEQDNIFAIDPSGGPMLSIGDTIDKYIIENIVFDGEKIKLILKEK